MVVGLPGARLVHEWTAHGCAASPSSCCPTRAYGAAAAPGDARAHRHFTHPSEEHGSPTPGVPSDHDCLTCAELAVLSGGAPSDAPTFIAINTESIRDGVVTERTHANAAPRAVRARPPPMLA